MVYLQQQTLAHHDAEGAVHTNGCNAPLPKIMLKFGALHALYARCDSQPLPMNKRLLKLYEEFCILLRLLLHMGCTDREF